jgi:hypothetical protein
MQSHLHLSTMRHHLPRFLQRCLLLMPQPMLQFPLLLRLR